MSKLCIFLFFLFIHLQSTFSLYKFSDSHLSRSNQITRPPYHKVSLYFNSNYESTKFSSICQIPGDKIDRLYYGYLIYQSGGCRFSKPDTEFFYGPKSGICGGEPQTSGDTYYGDIYQLLKFKERFPHVKVYASLGGPVYSNAINLHQTMLSASGINSIVGSCMNVFKQYLSVFDGFDLDLEYPCVIGDKKCGPNGYYYPASPDDKGAFTAFISSLKSQLGTIPLSIMVSSDTYKLNSIDFPAINGLIDHYNIKNYDITAGNFGDTFSGFHTFLGPILSDPLSSRISAGGYQAMRFLLTKGILPQKINMGSPFHGRGFQVTPGTNDVNNGFMTANGGLKTAKYEENVFDYKDIKNRFLTGTNSFYNNYGQSAYIYEKTTGMFICYENVQSAVEKVRFVKRNGLQGVVAWEFAADNEGELLTALNQNPV